MRAPKALGLALFTYLIVIGTAASMHSQIGREVSVPRHLADGEEFTMSVRELLEHGKRLFTAAWTSQEGGGRPLTKGTGDPLSDLSDPLVFPRNFNRISAPDSNSCAGCHNTPFGVPGGGGDFVTNAFVLGHRFDFATMNQIPDGFPTKGTTDESGNAVNVQTIAKLPSTPGMVGSGYIEMLTRQITADLQAIRDAIPVGGTASLASKGIGFGTLTRTAANVWDTSGVTGLQATSLAGNPPSLVVRPFHQAGAVVSLRQFTNNAMNHHHGIQSTERFGVGTDPDGDLIPNELTQADVTAAALFQATMAVPGRVIPNDPAIEGAIRLGEQRFQSIGCTSCHIPKLPLTDKGWIFTEPNPYNPPGNRQVADGPIYGVDLTSPHLPSPRLKVEAGVVWVPAFTDLRLHDITDGPGDPNAEALDMHEAAGSPGFFAGNRRFLTRKLWGAANEPPYFHHGMFTTMREAVLAHGGEAAATRAAFQALSAAERDAIIEFLKSLQVLPPGTPSLVVDERGNPRQWRSIF